MNAVPADTKPPGSKYDRLIAAAKGVPTVTTVVVHPCDESSLRGAIESAEAGIIKAILVGPAARIRDVAPLHQPHNLAPVKAILNNFPALPQVACFDTAFHRDHDALADYYAIPHRACRSSETTGVNSRPALTLAPHLRSTISLPRRPQRRDAGSGAAASRCLCVYRRHRRELGHYPRPHCGAWLDVALDPVANVARYRGPRAAFPSTSSPPTKG